MRNPLLAILSTGLQTQRDICPNLPEDATGLPTVTDAPCRNCGACTAHCPTQAITLSEDTQGTVVALDRGRCLGCNHCVAACPTRTLVADRSTRTATHTRTALVLSNRATAAAGTPPSAYPFHRSLHIREVSTGDNVSDLEIVASTNAVFDVARFGVHFVASPRFADALIVTGPVGRAMREPLLRCYEAMAEPRIIIAVGASAISGGLHHGGYAEANGVADLLPVTSFIPGDPPHPWSIIHGILLAMGRN
ncbi:MAG TPA: 4Fe-4S dicluster domain-containing protein [Armatimonadota bacterium]|jgi:Ni,Fe-hydrogenase III small subunit/ferredoxin